MNELGGFKVFEGSEQNDESLLRGVIYKLRP